MNGFFTENNFMVPYQSDCGRKEAITNSIKPRIDKSIDKYNKIMSQ